MAAFTFDFKVDLVIRGEHGTLANAYGSGDGGIFDVENVHGEHGIHFWVFKDAVLNHGYRAARTFLGGLEDELDTAVQAGFTAFKQLGGAQKRCHVGVVAAGMHFVVFRFERGARFFVDVEGVHVCPEGYGLSLDRMDGTAGVANPGENAGMAVKGLVGNAHGFQLSGDIGCGLGQVQPGFGDFMQCPSPGDDVVFDV